MFGGTNALHCPQDRLYISPADKLARFEFSDAACTLTGYLLHNRQRALGQKRTGYLGEVLAHPALYHHYPELAHAPYELWWSNHQTGGHCVNGRMVLYAAPDDQAQTLRSNICHETQHLIQLLENFSRGGSSTSIFNELSHKHRHTTNEKQLTPEVRKTLKRDAYTQYRNLPGEKEAFDVQTRLDWSDAQRAAVKPVNAILADDATGVRFAPRGLLSTNERIALATYTKLRRRILKAQVG